MKRKSLLAIVLTLAMVFTLCACTGTKNPGTGDQTDPDELSATQIAEKMQNALKSNSVGKLETIMDLTMSINTDESGKMDMVMKNATETTVSYNPVSGYSVATVDMDIAGQKTQRVVESYSIVENNEIVNYVNTDGVWLRVSTGQAPDAFAASASAVVVDTASLTKDETITKWNDKEAIVLKYSLSGSELQKAVDGVLGIMSDTFGSESGDLDDLDYSKLSCSATLYLDPNTYLPFCMEQTLTGMTDVMASFTEQLGAEVDVSDCTTTATFVSFDAQEEISLPEGAVEKAGAWSRLLANEPDNGNGTFTIREGMVLIDLVHPEGFEVAEKDYDHVTFKRDDYRQIAYTVSYITGETTLGSGEYFISENDDSEERWTTLGGGKVDRTQANVATDAFEFTCDLLATTWETGRTDATFYAWTPLANDGSGTYYLYIEVTDGYNDGLGFSKSADITSDEFAAYLNAASSSKLTAE